MKISKWFFGLFTLISLFACEKHCEQYQRVEVSFFDGSGNLTFTGNQGQGTFTLTEDGPVQFLPATGTYSVRITSWTGGCPMFASDANDIRVANAYLGTGADSVTLTPTYNVYSNCE